jgi:hypothetical protein
VAQQGGEDRAIEWIIPKVLLRELPMLQGYDSLALLIYFFNLLLLNPES